MPRILVVDVDDGVREVIAALLDLEGHDVIVCPNAHVALQALDDHASDLLITDVATPEMDGIALVAAARQRQPDLPVIVLSAVYRGAAPPGTIFAPKPFDIDALAAQIDRMLGQRERRIDLPREHDHWACPAAALRAPRDGAR